MEWLEKKCREDGVKYDDRGYIEFRTYHSVNYTQRLQRTNRAGMGA